MLDRIIFLCLSLLLSECLFGQYGVLDETFTPENVLNATVMCSAIQNDDKILVGGFFSNNSAGLNRIARFNTDGSLDNTFNSGSGFSSIPGHSTTPTVKTLAIQDDGKIIVGGGFSIYNNDTVYRIARLHIDGTLDQTFENTSVFGLVRTVAIQNDGKIVVGGNFLDTINYTRNHITRLNTDGSVDETFAPISGFNANFENVNGIVLQPDGKIVVAGNFTEYDGVARNRIVRINSDGSLDYSFNPGSGFFLRVASIALQEDGKIVAGGAYTGFNGVVSRYITRLNSDGSLDESFNIGMENGFNQSVHCVRIQADGKIIVSGLFSKYGNEDVRSIARLNTDGTLDQTFNTSASSSVSVRAINFQSDGKIIVAGDFYFFNSDDEIRNRVARLTSGTLDIPNENVEHSIQLFPNPASAKVFLKLQDNMIGGSVLISNLAGQIIEKHQVENSLLQLDLEDYEAGVYLIQIFTENGIITRRFVKN